LPDDLKLIIDISCKAINIDMLSDYTAKNNLALKFFESENIEIIKFPEDVLNKLEIISNDILKEISTTDEITKEIYTSYINFKNDVSDWTNISDAAYIKTR